MKKYNLSICAVVLNEVYYLAEWLEFHILEGVEHFFLYDNGSTDETQFILNKYTEKGYVTWELMPEKPVQFAAYNKCLKDHGEESEWIAFIDADEFLYSNYPNLPTFLNRFPKDTPGVAARWWLYGSNGKEELYAGLVTERFLRKAEKPDKHVKSIVRPALVECVGKNPHVFYTKDGSAIVDETGKELPVEYAVMEGGTANLIRIAHFHTKSREEYFERKKLPDPGTNRIRDYDDVVLSFAAHDVNDVFDPSAARHVNEINKRLS